jgi:hypothetical protein
MQESQVKQTSLKVDYLGSDVYLFFRCWLRHFKVVQKSYGFELIFKGADEMTGEEAKLPKIPQDQVFQFGKSKDEAAAADYQGDEEYKDFEDSEDDVDDVGAEDFEYSGAAAGVEGKADAAADTGTAAANVAPVVDYDALFGRK